MGNQNRVGATVIVYIAGVERTDCVLHDFGVGTESNPGFARFEILELGGHAEPQVVQGRNPQFTNALVQIYVGGIWVHYGRIVSIEIQRNASGESAVFTSRFDQHMFGDPLSNAPIAENADIDSVLIANGHEIVLNPLYDGLIVPNRIIQASSDGLSHSAILEPQQAFRRPADLIVKPWSLDYAVQMVCGWMNPSETHITNPTYAEISAVIPFDKELIQNVRFRAGAYLPEVLDSLLIPYGYGWKVELISDTSRKIRVYERGNTANRITLNNPASGATFRQGDDVISLRVENDIVENSISEVVLIGGTQQVETTLELTPDWDSTKESELPISYQLGSPLWATDPTLVDVFRRWTVVPRTGTGREGLDAAGWRSLMGIQDPFFTRQQFMPCITRNLAGEPFGRFRGCFIEYGTKAGSAVSGTLGDDADWEWTPLEGKTDRTLEPTTIDSRASYNALRHGKSVEILKDELGIYFNGPMPPMLQQNLGVLGFRLRITATLESVTRHVVNKVEVGSRLEETKTVVIQLPNGFPFRKITSSVLTGRSDANYDAVIDSTTKMNTFAQDVLDRQKFPTTKGILELPDLRSDLYADLGKAVEEVDGLEFSFYNGFSYPTIKAITFDVQNQRTVLTLGDPR